MPGDRFRLTHFQVLHVRIASAPDVTGRLVETLTADSGVLNLVVLKGAARRPGRVCGAWPRNRGSGSPAAQALVHLTTPCDHIHEHADEREYQDQDQPPGLGPPAEVMAAEDVDDDPDEQVHPDQQ